MPYVGLSTVRVILTCGPSGHSEEHDEREEMNSRELHLSVQLATTPIWNYLWPPTGDNLIIQSCLCINEGASGDRNSAPNKVDSSGISHRPEYLEHDSTFPTEDS